MYKKSPGKIISVLFATLICLLIAGQAFPVSSASLVNQSAYLAPISEYYPYLSIVEESEQGVVIEFSPPEPKFEHSSIDGAECQSISMTGVENILTDQNLFIPVQGAMLGIPPDAAPSLRIVKAEFEVLPGHFTLCPLEKPGVDPSLADLLPLNGLPNEYWRYYDHDSFSPTSPAELVETGFIRSQRYAQIRLNPVQYNPASGELRTFTSIRVEIQFNVSTNKNISENAYIKEAHFENILRDVLINYDQARPWRAYEQTSVSAISGFEREAEPLYKISVDHDGIYQIFHADLLAAGVPIETLDALDPRTFQLFNDSDEISIQIEGEQDSSFDPGDTLLFYGQKTNTRYTDTNVYWLTWGQANGLRMNVQDVTPTGTAPVPQDHSTTLKIEKDLYYYSAHSSGPDNDHWYWGNIISVGSPVSAEYDFKLTNLSSLDHTVTLHGLLKGYTATPLHHSRIYINDKTNLVDELTFASGAEFSFSTSFPSSYLVEGTNKIIVEINPNGSSSVDFIFVNHFALDYAGSYFADENYSKFIESGHWAFTIDGFNTPEIHIFDITTPTQPVILTGGVLEATTFGHQVQFETDTTEPHHYLTLGTNRILSPISITPAGHSNWKSTAIGADYIIISHSDFIAEVQSLANLRTSQGYRVQVVVVEDIYDEFNAGVFSPEAIRTFLAYAYAHWSPPAPSFVLLVGDGHYDYKDNLGYGEAIFIPPYLDKVDPIVGETATDNRYVSISGDDILPDMHIGRFPVSSRTEAQVLVEKTVNYETTPPEGDWKTVLTFVADNADSGGNFPVETDQIISYVSPGYAVENIYLGITHNSTSAKTDIKAAINTGRLLVHYAGHGSVVQWASEGLLKVSDLPTLTNHGMLPFMLPMTCSEGYFVRPSLPGANYSSLGESIVRMSGGGAVGSWSPTGFGMAVGHMILEEHLVNNLFNHNHNQIGYLTTQAKYHLFATTGAFRDLIETYIVFGDPALRLNTIPIELPGPSELVARTVSTSQIDLTWRDNASDETTSRIERSLTGTENWVEIGDVDANVTAYSDTDLYPGTAYYYRVSAYRESDGMYSNYSEPASATTLSLPAQPTGLMATAFSTTRIDLTWTDNAENEVGYEIERALTGSGDWAVIGSVAANLTDYNDTDLTPGTTYYYRVRAYLSGDDEYSHYSNIAYAMTKRLFNQFYPLFLSKGDH